MTGTASYTGTARRAASVPASRRAGATRGDAAMVALLVGVLGICVGALVLALAGVFRWWAVPPAALLFAGGLWLLRPRTPRAAGAAGPSVGHGPVMAAVAVAAVVTVANLAMPSELLLTGRDGGTYTNTAGWLSHHGDLVIDAEVGPFDAPDLESRVAGFQEVRDEEDLYPQFIHTFPALLATAAGVAGPTGMLVVNPLLSGLALLTVFAFATRIVRPWTAVLVTGALAVNLVFTYYARAPFTEVLALLFTFGGLWALDVARVTADRRTSVLAGLLLGGTALARLDGLVLTLALIGLVALRIVDDRHARASADGRWTPGAWWPGVGVGALATSGLAVLDMAIYSPFYLSMHTDYLLPLAAAALLLPFGAVIAAGPIGAAVWAWSARHRRVLGWVVATVLVVGALYAVALRPVVEYATWERTTPIGALQEAAGQPVDEHRTYAESTMRWLSWYLGPMALAAGVAGWALLSARAAHGRARAAVPFLLLFSGLSIVYLWRPSITPDHIWAMRRFLTITIPGLLLLAGWFVEWLATHRAATGRAPRAVGRVAAVLVGAGIMLGGLAATVPVAGVQELEGVAAGWEQVCDRLGPDAAVLVLQGDFTPWATTQGFRSFCDIPAAHGSPSPQRADELARAWASEGRRLVLVASTPAALEGAGAPVSRELVDVDHHRLAQTLVHRPSRLVDGRWQLFAAEVLPGEARP